MKLSDVKKFINQLKQDFPDIKLSIAPMASSMIGDVLGMGNFCYKELYKSEGQCIDWFNSSVMASFYLTHMIILKNGYPPEKINMGMESGQFNKTNFKVAIGEVKKCIEE